MPRSRSPCRTLFYALWSSRWALGAAPRSRVSSPHPAVQHARLSSATLRTARKRRGRFTACSGPPVRHCHAPEAALRSALTASSPSVHAWFPLRIIACLASQRPSGDRTTSAPWPSPDTRVINCQVILRGCDQHACQKGRSAPRPRRSGSCRTASGRRSSHRRHRHSPCRARCARSGWTPARQDQVNICVVVCAVSAPYYARARKQKGGSGLRG